MPNPFEIRKAIDLFVGDRARSEDEIRAGIAEVTQHVGGYAAIFGCKEAVLSTLPLLGDDVECMVKPSEKGTGWPSDS